MEIYQFAKELDGQFATHAARINRVQPWFGYIELQVSDKQSTKSYRIGKERHPEESIIDWRHPYAGAYYKCNVGDQFEHEHEAHLPPAAQYVPISGVVSTKGKVIGGNRTIRQLFIETEEDHYALIKDDNNIFVVVDGVPKGYFDPDAGGLPDILAHITPEQYRLITSASGQPLVIQGRAGSGKTSVALYRLSYLTAPPKNASFPPLDPSRVLFVMFNKALSEYVKLSLAKHKLEDVLVDTFHGWALMEIRRAYRGAIEIEPRSGSDYRVASRIKKHAGMLVVVEKFLERQIARMKEWLTAKLEPYDAEHYWLDRLEEKKEPIVVSLISLRGEILKRRDAAEGLEKEKLKQVHKIFQYAVERMTLYKEDLYAILSSPRFLSKYLPDIPMEKLETLQRFQFDLQIRKKGERRPGPWISFDDFALILRIIQLKNGGFPNAKSEDIQRYEHLVIDETQDFGAIELKVLLDAVYSRTGTTIVGDINQQIVPQNDFIGWQKLEEELGVDDAHVAHLNVGHRCTREIMTLADRIIGEKPGGGRPGLVPEIIGNDQVGGWMAGVGRVIVQRLRSHPMAHIAVVCPHRDDVEPVFEKLRGYLADMATTVDSFSSAIRTGRNDSFVFEPGVTVTNMRQIKGLEFDTVILVDAGEEYYPDNQSGKRLLYTAITRAQELLYFAGDTELTPLLRDAMAAGLINDSSEEVPEVLFDSEEDDMPF